MIEVIERPNKKLKTLEFSYRNDVDDKDVSIYSSSIGKFP